MEMIRWGIERKCKTYNFGGIIHLDQNDGLFKFKMGFCKEEGLETYIGEFSKVYKPATFFAVTKLLPIKKKIERKIRKSRKSK